MSTLPASLNNAAVDFARRVILPNTHHWEKLGRVPYEAYEQAGEAGLCGLRVPEAYGGQGLDVAGMAAVMEILAAQSLSAAFSFVVHNNHAAFVASHGNAGHRARYLDDLLAGRKVGAFLLTEPQAGSDAQAIATTAVQTDAGWVINGEKAWVSNATFADVLSVYVQTEPGSGSRGIAAFLIEASHPGVRLTDPYDLLSGHALGAGGVVFDDCEVGDEALVLGPGEAFAAALGGIDIARINVAAMCCGMLDECLRIAVRHAGRRLAFGQPVLDFQGLEWELADAATDLAAARALTNAAIESSVAGDPGAGEAAAHAKKFATRAAFDGISACMQAMGAVGYTTQYPLARHLAGAKMAQYLDGTTGIQNVVISRAMRRRYGGRSEH